MNAAYIRLRQALPGSHNILSKKQTVHQVLVFALFSLLFGINESKSIYVHLCVQALQYIADLEDLLNQNIQY